MSIIRWLAEKFTGASSEAEADFVDASAIKKRWAERAKAERSTADDGDESSDDDSSANAQNSIEDVRKVIRDDMLIAFFRALRSEPDQDILAVELVNEGIDQGTKLEEIFDAEDGYGPFVTVEPIADGKFKIEFGCVAGPTEGDGGTWLVAFDSSGKILEVVCEDSWIS